MRYRPRRVKEMGANQLLENPIRRRICEYLVGCDEAYYNMMRRALHVNNGVIDYHLKILQRGGLVRTVAKDSHTYFIVVGKLPEDLKG